MLLGMGVGAGCQVSRAGTGVLPPRIQYRPSSECAAATARAALDSSAIVPVQLDSLALPPTPIPSTMRHRGFTVSMLVDTTGRALSDSTIISPSMEASYAPRFLGTLATYRFRPASLDRCPVPRRFTLIVTL